MVGLLCIPPKAPLLPQVSPALARIVGRMVVANEIMGAGVGPNGRRPQQYVRYTALTQLATTAELYALLEHPSPVVRGYSFQAMTLRSEVELLPILFSHLVDTAIVYTLYGCVARHERVGDFMIDLVSLRSPPRREGQRLAYRQTLQLDSALVSTNTILEAREAAMDQTRPLRIFVGN